MATSSPRPAIAELEAELERVHALHEARASNPILAGALERLASWQSRRLASTYADLARDASLLPEVHRVGEALLRDHPAAAERLVQRWIGAATRYAGA